MSCDSAIRNSVPPALRAILLLATTLLLTTACGHKKSPIPPPSKVPQRVVLQAHQRGHEAVLKFPYPTLTISGTSLPGISKIEIWRYSQEVPEFAVELLAQEAEERKQAQALLDELGLSLYEVPVETETEGGIFPDSTLPPEYDEASGLPMTPEGLPMPPADPAAPEVTAPDAADDSVEAEPGAGDDVETELSEEAPDDDLDAGMADDVGGDSAGAQEESSAAEDGILSAAEDGDQAADDSDEAEGGEESELSEEELLEIQVETARNLLRSPPTPKSSFITATAKDFKKGAELQLEIDSDSIQSHLIGDAIVARVALPPRPEEGPEIGHLFAVKVFALNGKPSDFSALVAILPTDTPPSPQEVSVEAQADGVHLAWSADEDPDGGYRIYRRDAQVRHYGDPVGNVPAGFDRTFIDRQAIFGARYIYGLTAVDTVSPLLESDLSSEHEIDYQDRFGPATPGGLVAFPEAGRVRLLWTTVPDADIAGYEVLRRAPSAEESVVITSELITRGQYLDETVESGAVWIYSVVAVDTSGNRSVVSAETEARVP